MAYHSSNIIGDFGGFYSDFHSLSSERYGMFVAIITVYICWIYVKVELVFNSVPELSTIAKIMLIGYCQSPDTIYSR